MAIIHPHESNLRAALAADPSTAGLSKEEIHKICEDKNACGVVLKQCNAVGKKNGFKGMELLEAVVLTPEEWTADNQMMTAAQKINRKKIAEKYKDEIKVRPCGSCLGMWDTDRPTDLLPSRRPYTRIDRPCNSHVLSASRTCIRP